VIFVTLRPTIGFVVLAFVQPRLGQGWSLRNLSIQWRFYGEPWDLGDVEDLGSYNHSSDM